MKEIKKETILENRETKLSRMCQQNGYQLVYDPDFDKVRILDLKDTKAVGFLGFNRHYRVIADSDEKLELFDISFPNPKIFSILADFEKELGTEIEYMIDMVILYDDNTKESDIPEDCD